MGDYDYGTVLLDGVYAVLYLLGGYGVQAGCRLIQENHRRVLEEQAGYGYPLLLSAGKVSSLVPELKGKRHYLVIDAGFTGSLLHFLMGGIGLAVEYVLLYGAVKNVVLLEHQPYMVTQVFGVIFPQVHTVQSNAAALRFIELVQQVHYGALACAGESHKGGYPSGFNGHIHPEESLVAVGIGKINA